MFQLLSCHFSSGNTFRCVRILFPSDFRHLSSPTGPWAMIRQPSPPDSSHHPLHTYNYHIDSDHAPVFSAPGTRTLDKPYLLLYPASFQSPIRISIVQWSINKASGSTLYSSNLSNLISHIFSCVDIQVYKFSSIWIVVYEDIWFA